MYEEGMYNSSNRSNVNCMSGHEWRPLSSPIIAILMLVGVMRVACTEAVWFVFFAHFNVLLGHGQTINNMDTQHACSNASENQLYLHTKACGSIGYLSMFVL